MFNSACGWARYRKELSKCPDFTKRERKRRVRQCEKVLIRMADTIIHCRTENRPCTF